jgi:hypothetical protein
MRVAGAMVAVSLVSWGAAALQGGLPGCQLGSTPDTCTPNGGLCHNSGCGAPLCDPGYTPKSSLACPDLSQCCIRGRCIDNGGTCLDDSSNPAACAGAWSGLVCEGKAQSCCLPLVDAGPAEASLPNDGASDGDGDVVDAVSEQVGD